MPLLVALIPVFAWMTVFASFNARFSKCAFSFVCPLRHLSECVLANLDSLVPTSCSTCLSCIYVVLYCVCRGGGLIPPASFRTGVMPHWRFLPLLVSPGSVFVTVAQSAKCKVCYLWRNVFHFDGSMRHAHFF